MTWLTLELERSDLSDINRLTCFAKASYLASWAVLSSISWTPRIWVPHRAVWCAFAGHPWSLSVAPSNFQLRASLGRFGLRAHYPLLFLLLSLMYFYSSLRMLSHCVFHFYIIFSGERWLLTRRFTPSRLSSHVLFSPFLVVALHDHPGLRRRTYPTTCFGEVHEPISLIFTPYYDLLLIYVHWGQCTTLSGGWCTFLKTCFVRELIWINFWNCCMILL